MSRRLQLQIAVLKVLDTLIDEGIVPCHEKQPQVVLTFRKLAPDIEAKLDAVFNSNIGRDPSEIQAERRAWRNEPVPVVEKEPEVTTPTTLPEDAPPPAGWDAIEGDDPEPPTEDDVPDPPLLIDAKTVGVLLSRSPGRLSADAQKGDLPPPIKVGRSRMWRRAEIETWVAAGCPKWAPVPVKLAPVPAEPVDPAQPEDVYGTAADAA